MGQSVLRNTGTNARPLCTATVMPTISGVTTLREINKVTFIET